MPRPTPRSRGQWPTRAIICICIWAMIPITTNRRYSSGSPRSPCARSARPWSRRRCFRGFSRSDASFSRPGLAGAFTAFTSAGSPAWRSPPAIFFRGSSTFRLDSGLTFGILLSFCAYLSAARKWAPPVFFLGIGIAVLSKGPPGLLPLFVVPLHAGFDADRGVWNREQIIRWAAWSPLLLLPFSWWLYLFLADGMRPFHALFDDLIRAKTNRLPPWKSFWLNYIQLAFFKYYWMWLPFALLGGWMAVKEIRRPPVDGSLRA